MVLHGLCENTMEGEDTEVKCLDTCPEEAHTEMYDSKATGKMKASINDEDYAGPFDLNGPDSGSESDVKFDPNLSPRHLTICHRMISSVL